MEIFYLIVLILFSALLALAETAITTVSMVKVKRMAEAKIPGAASLLRLRENLSRTLATVLFGNNVVNIAASALATAMVIQYLTQHGLERVGLAVGIATGIMTFLILVFGEITPKTVAIRSAERFALILAIPIEILSVIFYPLVLLFIFISRPFVLLLGGKIPEKGPFVTLDEIKTLISMGREEGLLEEEEKEMIHSIFEFGETTAKEIMTPRPDIVMLEANDSIAKAIETIVREGHSRIPVYEANIDNVTGVILAKELLRVSADERDGKITHYIRPIMTVPESKKLDELLHQMQAVKAHIAILVDEYGGTAGMVTFEDLLEEIVGEIRDEFDREERSVEFIDANTMLVDARLTITEFEEKTQLPVPAGDYDTIAGFVMSLIGKMPGVGTETRYEDMILTVEKVQKRRITRVKIVKLTHRLEEEVVGG